MKIKWIIKVLLAFLIIWNILVLSIFNTSSDPYQRQERYTNQFHIQMDKVGLMNDIQGGFYRDGVWHIYYLYNDQARFDDYGVNKGKWGSSMYHITTTDWVHWNYVGIALKNDATDYNDVSSGTVFEDKNNSFGYGSDAIIAMTSTFGKNEQNILGFYSTDGGYSFSAIKQTPIINYREEIENPGDFRDPYFFEIDNKYVMYLAQNDSFGVWVSDNPTEGYKKTGKYVAKHPMLECPNLFEMKVSDSNEKKWVLFYCGNGSWGPDADNFSSGTYYVVGTINKNFVFKPDENQETKRLDFGTDFYAAKFMTKNTTNRNIDELISTAWVGNWNYIYNAPDDGRIGAMSLARKLVLKKTNNNYSIESSIFGFKDFLETKKIQSYNTNNFTENGGTYKLSLNFDKKVNNKIDLEIKDSIYELKFHINYETNSIDFKRTTNYERLVDSVEFNLSRSLKFDSDKISNNFEVYLDKTVIEIKLSNYYTFTFLKFNSAKKDEKLNFNSSINTDFNYSIIDLKNTIIN
ncbi:levanbiose-producing levanase [Spiroplasma gladiatoris]|uniref:Levanbiose-producing levanase n=1 Tax=Spiroplasma gladiatoris TaxID=2143 RepID=A0A4P7AIG0_9MOLU|nr:glycoside hydrolase family 32 protein [Spiroplasma gladiatoris]QBQ07971.1 levanbiose-producing levanase [Spiroplasma gladiatoris]